MLKTDIKEFFMKLRLGLLVVLSVSCLVGCGNSAPNADWTVMIYLSGNNLEDVQGSASINLEELAKSGKTNSKVNVILRLGGANNWVDHKYGLVHEFGKTEDYLYSNVNGDEYGTYTLLKSQDQMYTGDPVNLLSYINETKAKYPAKKYGLWVWGHGMNPIGGLIGDSTYKDRWVDMETMTYNNFEYAIKKSGVHFEHINFDCCLLANVEMLSHLYGYTNYVTFSENTIPGFGQAYDTFFPYLYAHPEMDGKEFGKKLVDFYALRYPDDNPDGQVRSFVTADVNKTPALVNAFNNFYYEYSKKLFNPADYKKIMKLHKDNSVFNYSNFDVDLVQYLNLVDQNGLSNPYANEVIRAVNDMVTSKTMGPNTTSCGGISHCLWIDQLYNTTRYDYDVYSSQIPKLYGYVTFLDTYNPGWHAPAEFYEKNNITPYGELPFKDFNLKADYMDNDNHIDSLKVKSGVPVMTSLNFNAFAKAKMLKIEDWGRISTTIIYSLGNYFGLKHDENNIYSPVRDNTDWLAFYPFIDSEDEEMKNLGYPLPLNDITSRISDIDPNLQIFTSENFVATSKDGAEDDILPLIYKSNGVYTLSKYVRKNEFSYLPETFKLADLNNKSHHMTELDKKTLTFTVRQQSQENIEICKLANFNPAKLSSYFVMVDIAGGLIYNYTMSDIYGNVTEFLNKDYKK